MIIVLNSLGGFIATIYTTVFIDKLTPEDWDKIHDILNSGKYYSITLAVVILSYITDILHACRSALQKCVKEGNCRCLVSMLSVKCYKIISPWYSEIKHSERG